MTEESSEVPRELTESIKDVIGRKIKIAVKKKVKLEVKGDKVENKVLVLTSCRAFLVTARIPTKSNVQNRKVRLCDESQSKYRCSHPQMKK